MMHLIDRNVGGDQPFFLIAGPCVIEEPSLCLAIAEELARIRDRYNILVIFKASFDKANRSSDRSFRGPGMDAGLTVLQSIKVATDLPVLTDVHAVDQCEAVADVVDVLQIPAFLCRQTDLVKAAAATGRPLNIKKGQWMAAEDMRAVADKCGPDHSLMLCERGTSFGYHNLVVDMRSLEIMREVAPVVFDATHSVQRPGALGEKSGGDSRFAPLLARSAVAAGVAGLFFETHPEPVAAMSDGPNMIRLDQMSQLIGQLLAIDEIIKR